MRHQHEPLRTIPRTRYSYSISPHTAAAPARASQQPQFGRAELGHPLVDVCEAGELAWHYFEGKPTPHTAVLGHVLSPCPGEALPFGACEPRRARRERLAVVRGLELAASEARHLLRTDRLAKLGLADAKGPGARHALVGAKEPRELRSRGSKSVAINVNQWPSVPVIRGQHR